MKPHRFRRRILSFEQFESRRLMAIDASIRHDGSLGIEGAGTTDDDYSIVGTERPGEFVITGRNGTVVNGVVNGEVTFTGLTGSIWARSNWNTNNRITVDNVYIAGDLQISLPSYGSNTVILGANGVVSTTRSVSVAMGGAKDNIVRFENYNVLAGGAIFVDGSFQVGSSDSISLVGASTGIADVNVTLRHGHDSLLLDGVTSSGAFWIVGGYLAQGEKNIAILRSSAATFMEIYFFPTDYHCSIYLDTCFADQRISIYGNTDVLGAPKSATAVVTVARCEAERIWVRTGQGNDLINLYGNNVVGPPGIGWQSIYVDSRSGIDEVQLSYNVVHGIVYAALGNGGDFLSAVGNLFDDVAYFNGMVGEYQTGTDGINRLTLVNNSIAIPAFFHLS